MTEDKYLDTIFESGVSMTVSLSSFPEISTLNLLSILSRAPHITDEKNVIVLRAMKLSDRLCIAASLESG